MKRRHDQTDQRSQRPLMGCVVALALLFCGSPLLAAPAPLPPPRRAVLQLNFHGTLVERKAPFDWFGRSRISLEVRLRQLRKVAHDPNILAIVLRFGAVQLSFAQVQELSAAF